jgi:amidase
MTRTVADAARMLQVMAGWDPEDPSSLDAPVPNYGVEVGRAVGGMRIGVDWSYVTEGVEEPVIGAVRHALDLLTDQGAIVQELALPESHADLVDHWGITCAVECAEAHRDYYPAQKDRYGPVLAELIELGLSPPEGAYQKLEEQRGRFREEFNRLFETVDVVISPSMPYLPPPADDVLALSADPNRASGLTFTAPFNYSGHPTLSIPGGLSAERLPLSVQFIGPLLGERQLLRLGAQYEAAIGFKDRPIP